MFEPTKEVLERHETSADGKKKKISFYVPDPSHSHLLYRTPAPNIRTTFLFK